MWKAGVPSLTWVKWIVSNGAYGENHVVSNLRDTFNMISHSHLNGSGHSNVIYQQPFNYNGGHWSVFFFWIRLFLIYRYTG